MGEKAVQIQFAIQVKSAIWFRLKVGLNRVNVLLGSKHHSELYLIIGQTLLLISTLNRCQNILVWVDGWFGGWIDGWVAGKSGDNANSA